MGARSVGWVESEVSLRLWWSPHLVQRPGRSDGRGRREAGHGWIGLPHQHWHMVHASQWRRPQLELPGSAWAMGRQFARWTWGRGIRIGIRIQMCFGILDPLFGVLVFFRIALNSIRIANHVIHNTYNIYIYIYIYIYSNDALINRLLLMVNASWLMAHWLLRAPWHWGSGQAPDHPWAMSHEPLTINHRLINELFDYIF